MFFTNLCHLSSPIHPSFKNWLRDRLIGLKIPNIFTLWLTEKCKGLKHISFVMHVVKGALAGLQNRPDGS